MSAININKNNFQNEIMDSEKTVLLDFWAPWCAPCRMVVPIVEEIASERRDIKVGKINVDEEPESDNPKQKKARQAGEAPVSGPVCGSVPRADACRRITEKDARFEIYQVRKCRAFLRYISALRE